MVLACAVPLAASAQAGASNAYLKIDGVPGEATAVGHANEIEVDGFSWDVTAASSTGGGGGGGAGKSVFSDLTIEKRLDRSSPTLLVAAANGQHYPKAVLTVVAPGDKPFQFLKYCLTDVVVTKLATTFHNGYDLPLEELGLDYRTIFENYTQQKSTGTTASWTGGWDIAANLAVTSCATT